MGFSPELSDKALIEYRKMNISANVYMLYWSNPVVLKAKVNQAAFTNNIHSIDYDSQSVDTDYIDALEGYQYYLSKTDNIFAAYHNGRLRKNTTATQLSVKQNSFKIEDDDYIFVVKDVKLDTKNYRADNADTIFTDYNLPYRQPIATISNIQSSYVKIINDEGYIDLVVSPAAAPTADGATISTWTLDLDVGTQQSFDANTGAAVIRYTNPGNYMPRWSVIDSNGELQWFTPHVHVIPNSLKTFVNFKFGDIQITANTSDGYNASVPVFDEIGQLLPNNYCTLYSPEIEAINGSGVLFVGNIGLETQRNAINEMTQNIQNATLTIDGFATQMAELAGLEILFSDDQTPSVVDQIKNLTPWRAASTYLTEFTNLNNICSLSFDDTTDIYRYTPLFVGSDDPLTALVNMLSRTNEIFEFSPSGGFKVTRNARYLTTAERLLLPTVANLTKQDFAVQGSGEIFSIEVDPNQTIAVNNLAGGWINTSGNTLDILVATVPAIVPSKGTEYAQTDNQILPANSTNGEAQIIIALRGQNDYSAKQPLPTLRPAMRDIYAAFFVPSASQWYTNEIDIEDNLRQIEYTTDDRWLLPDISLNYNVVSGRFSITPTFVAESKPSDFQALIFALPPSKQWDNPVVPPFDVYDNDFELPDLDSPGGGGFPPNESPPLDKDDMAGNKDAQDPWPAENKQIYDGSFGTLWDDNNLWTATDLAANTNPTWVLRTPPGLGSQIIKQFAWDRFVAGSRGGYCVSNNDDIDTATSKVHNTPNAVTTVYVATDVEDVLLTAVTALPNDNVAAYGKFKTYTPGGGFPIFGLTFYGGTDDMDGDGTPDLLPSSHASLSQPASESPGVYDSSAQVFKGSTDTINGGMGCTIKWPIPPGVRITGATMRIHYNRPITVTDGYKRSSIEGDTLQFGSLTAPPLLENHSSVSTTSNMPIEPGTQTHLYFNCAVDKKAEDGAFAWIEGIGIAGSIEIGHAGIVVSTDRGDAFDPPKDAGLMDLGDGSMNYNFKDTPLVTNNSDVGDGNVVYWPVLDQPVTFAAPEGITVGQYAKALHRFGKSGIDYLLAPDGGAVGLYLILDGVRTDITPNDGANNGFVVGQGGLAMSNLDANHIWFLGLFGGIAKLAFTTTQGAAWEFNTQGLITNEAVWIDANINSRDQVVIADGDTLWYSSDGGPTLVAKTIPTQTAKGIAIL